MNIPIYRAKKIDSDEYVEFNYYFEKDNKFYAINRVIRQLIDGWFTKTNVLIPLTQKIDATTLSISFPDMLDSQGNKIFASLSKDGKGGDIMKNDEYEFVAKYSDCGIVLKSKSGELFMGAEYIEINNLKVTGIQK